MHSHDTIFYKELVLRELFKPQVSIAVAFSGGDDSTYLLAAANDVPGAGRVLALTADTPLIPRHEIERARELAVEIGCRHEVVSLSPLAELNIVANQGDRCHHCKRFVFSALLAEAHRLGFDHLAHAANADDRNDYRPGQRAAEELGVRAPLDEAGLTKADIRELSRRRSLRTWNVPAQNCLATRIPYGTPLDADILAQVEKAERFLHDHFGLFGLHVRHHGPMARLGTTAEDWATILTPPVRQPIIDALPQFGFQVVALDLGGYAAAA